MRFFLHLKKEGIANTKQGLSLHLYEKRKL